MLVGGAGHEEEPGLGMGAADEPGELGAAHRLHDEVGEQKVDRFRPVLGDAQRPRRSPSPREDRVAADSRTAFVSRRTVSRSPAIRTVSRPGGASASAAEGRAPGNGRRAAGRSGRSSPSPPRWRPGRAAALLDDAQHGGQPEAGPLPAPFVEKNGSKRWTFTSVGSRRRCPTRAAGRAARDACRDGLRGRRVEV
mgnify:CR=1 FL=1